MPRFTYKAKDSQSKTAEGIVEANSLKQAQSLLHERGFFIISLKEQTPGLFQKGAGTGIAFQDLVHFTRQLSTMITAGLTLDEALLILIAQIKKPKLILLLRKIEEEVKSGKSFASVLAKYPKVFPPVYLSLVQAGEASGKLDTILSRLAENLEKSRDFRNKIRGALVYPIIVISGMGVVSFIVMTVVVPRLTSLYQEFEIDLPLPTQIMITLSNILVNSWYVIVISIVLIFVVFMNIRKSKYGQFVLSTLILNIPVFGPLIKQSTLVEITKTLALLIEGGVPILTSLEIAQHTTNNVLYREAFVEAARKVEKGFPLSDPLMENKIMPTILGQMVAVGEHTGQLDDSLNKLSVYFETEADSAVKTLTTMIEPIVMVLLGIGVGFLVLAVLLPIYSLTSKF
ncbi:MAG: type IV pilus biogenesis protein PilC, type IV pilus assembly protein PilC [Candidatus Gottesmanbacteria bacterium GW2011_GWA2_43_14]|uniref:Type IV pilus biogenesis protein PilC, type IV pilus assembly protein PilC n=1 Tax=Candidatus Gottesmanbacteria bacterium GW2011_GWA2_43_14 TaxID=1618443 RepID=A0A0G1GCS0_9BACT|nr:MAG: type IV pilus biogenesis protein PilC, type IV pilus assembly protein PilC [Candidatus Gottesmanbacteria bacterium GW2011_GWA2_43_14]